MVPRHSGSWIRKNSDGFPLAGLNSCESSYTRVPALPGNRKSLDFRYDVACSAEPRIFSSGFFRVTVVSGAMDCVIQTLEPITAS